MQSLKEQLDSLPSVAGIVHTAMVLRDEFIKDWSFRSFTDVMDPKIKGACHACYHTLLSLNHLFRPNNILINTLQQV